MYYPISDLSFANMPRLRIVNEERLIGPVSIRTRQKLSTKHEDIVFQPPPESLDIKARSLPSLKDLPGCKKAISGGNLLE
jgi:hypothetical protein